MGYDIPADHHGSLPGKPKKEKSTTVDYDAVTVKCDVDYAAVTVRCDKADRNEDGTYTLWIPAQKLTTEQHAQIKDLFPNLSEKAYELINKELLLSALV